MGSKAETLSSKSAKEPYKRPEFDRMMKMIDSGKVSTLIVWQVNRIARNMIECSMVLEALRKGKLKRLITSEGEYNPDNSQLLLVILMGMAQDYSHKLSKSVKRGMNARKKEEYKIGTSPYGYSESDIKGVKVPNENQEYVKRAFDMYSTGHYSIRNILDILTAEGMVNRSGGPVSRSNMHAILKNSFYAGLLEYTDAESGEKVIVNGQHVGIVDLETFEKV